MDALSGARARGTLTSKRRRIAPVPRWRGLAPFLAARALSAGAADGALLGLRGPAPLVVVALRAAAAHPLERCAVSLATGAAAPASAAGLADGWRVAAVLAAAERRLLGPAALGVAAALRLRDLRGDAADPRERERCAAAYLAFSAAALPAACACVACGRLATYALFGPPPARRKRERAFARRLQRALDRTAPLPPDAPPAEGRPLGRARPSL